MTVLRYGGRSSLIFLTFGNSSCLRLLTGEKLWSTLQHFLCLIKQYKMETFLSVCLLVVSWSVKVKGSFSP